MQYKCDKHKRLSKNILRPNNSNRMRKNDKFDVSQTLNDYKKNLSQDFYKI